MRKLQARSGKKPNENLYFENITNVKQTGIEFNPSQIIKLLK